MLTTLVKFCESPFSVGKNAKDEHGEVVFKNICAYQQIICNHARLLVKWFCFDQNCLWWFVDIILTF